MDTKSKTKKLPRKLLSAAMASVFMISLSACADNNSNELFVDGTYAQSGEYQVKKSELWEELKWSVHSEIESQINNVVLHEQISKITTVMKNDYKNLSDSEKELFESEDEYNELFAEYKDRLVKYAFQDVYNLTFKIDLEFDEIESFTDSQIKIAEAQYVDEVFSNYGIEKIDNKTIADLIDIDNANNVENYFTLAKGLSELYYPTLAKELLAKESILEEIAEEEGETAEYDAEEDKIGYFATNKYVNEFKEMYGNKFDINAILIRFTSASEYEDTLRAFGLKINNKKLYYITGEAGKTYTYSEYIKYYDDFSFATQESEAICLTDRAPKAILELYVQIYNYIYGGYKSKLETSLTGLPAANQLNDLRSITNEIYNTYATGDQDALYQATVNKLNEKNEAATLFTREAIDDISSSFVTYLYETLSLQDNKTPYSVTTQSANGGQYIAYKFGEGEDTHNNIYSKDLTNDEILEIILKEENASIKSEIKNHLITDLITENKINSTLEEAIENVEVQIFDENVEIAYAANNTEYSKTIAKNKVPNRIACIKYDEKEFNFNIIADDKDENSIMIPGTGLPYGVYNSLEQSQGQTTAIDLLSTKIIKDTKAYKEALEDTDIYYDNVENILFNFANEQYATMGYPSSLGKYNFLMLYFHTADIDEIVENYYCVQYASTKLLTDYSSDSLISFFKKYSDEAYNNYFSMTAKRLVVYFDGDDDGQPDEASEWKEKEVTFNGATTKLEAVARELIYEVYSEINANSGSHTTKLTSLVEEINGSAKVPFDNNPVLVENQWAKYRYVGLSVKVEDVTATNSTVDINFNLKQRLYDYATKPEYQYFINNTTPTIYIEPLTDACKTIGNSQIVESNDGYNLLLVTQGTSAVSAELDADNYDDDLFTNFVIKYNDKYITIENVYNDNKTLSENQIKLFVLEYVSQGTTSLMPTSLSGACTTYLQPVISRFTSNETQRIILLEFIKNKSGEVSFEGASNADSFDKIIEINRRIADNYNHIYEDSTNTSNSFPNWWDEISTAVANFLIKEAE